MDGVDPDKISFTGFNYWANDLGYIQGPIAYWYRIPGSERGSGYLPITCDADAVDMLQFIPNGNRELDIYIVCLVERRILQPFELDAYEDEVDHLLYIGHAIDDLEYGTATSWNEQQEGRHEPNLENAGENNELGVEERSERNGATSTDNVQNIKGKHKVVEEEFRQKKKKGRPNKDVSIRYETRWKGKCSYAEDLYGSESSSSTEDPDYNSIEDSDYELVDEDDEVIFEANVDGDSNKVPEAELMGYAGYISDNEDNYSEGFPSLDGSSDDSAKDTGRFKGRSKKRFSKWKEFNKKFDMKNPTFEIGMAFPNSVVFKNAVRKHAVLTRKELRFVANTRHKVSVKCKTSAGCPFWIYSSGDKSSPTIYIKTLRTVHKCSEVKGKVYHCHAPFIADEYLDSFMNDEKWSREGIQNAVGRDFGMNVGFQLCYRAKKRAKKLAQGDFEEQYNLLESYAHELKKRNPGTSVWIQSEMVGDVSKFKRIYIFFEALKIGWRVGCRKVLCLDGCHLKGVHKGQLLAVVGVDGNNGMYPIAYAVVEKENKDSWMWFLELLQADLEIYTSNHYAFISDKQKGLEQAIATLFPQAEHRHCVMHLHNNFKGDGFTGLELKQLLWSIARATTMNQFTKGMEDMMAASENAWKWCNDRPAIHWSRSHFQEQFKCDILLNNHSESFNSSILLARKKPILGLLEDIRTSIMLRLANRRNSSAKWRCGVGPRVEKLLKKNTDWSHEYKALESRTMRFEIHGRGVACESGVISQHVVHLDKRSCSCRRWDLCGIPCAHAIAAIYSKGWSPEDFVDEYYT